MSVLNDHEMHVESKLFSLEVCDQKSTTQQILEELQYAIKPQIKNP